MIRHMCAADLEAVAEIWLDASREAHPFIPAEYWEGNAPLVKELLPQADVFVYEDAQGTQGFIGLAGEHIEGIFVRGAVRSRGIGTLLLNAAKEVRPSLTLNVYQKNERAIAFYQREGFKIVGESADEATNEQDYTMAWHRV